MISLEGRVALVTGASQGIGRACAVALGQAGAQVALAARNTTKLAELAAEIEAAGGKACPSKWIWRAKTRFVRAPKPCWRSSAKLEISSTTAALRATI